VDVNHPMFSFAILRPAVSHHALPNVDPRESNVRPSIIVRNPMPKQEKKREINIRSVQPKEKDTVGPTSSPVPPMQPVQPIASRAPVPALPTPPASADTVGST
jgi:hypothetical protein